MVSPFVLLFFEKNFEYKMSGSISSTYSTVGLPPYSRTTYAGIALIALAISIQSVAKTSFYILGTTITFGQHKGWNQGLALSLEETLINLTTSTISLFGFLFPKRVNQFYSP